MTKLMEENAGLKKQLADQGIELDRRNRQLEIEAALDNVRLRAGAMRNSSELGEASAVLFQQLKELGINTIRTAVGIFDDPNDAMELWLTSYADGGEMTRILYYFNLHIHPVFENTIPARQENKPYALTILSGNDIRSYYQTMSTYFASSGQQASNETEFFYSFFFPGGTINVVRNQSLNQEQCHTMIRVAQVFGLLYTRFLDLQKAEDSTREAQIESALERIRSRAQAMQYPEELKDVTAVFRHEMGALGEEELETSQIFIWDETSGKAECMAALKAPLPDNKIVSGEFELDLNDTWLGREILKFYGTTDKEVSIAVTGDKYKEWVRYCEARCESLRGYYGEEIDKSYHLCKFSDGAIGRMDTSLIPQESWDLLKRVASVFSLAYSRFKDLTQARIDLQNLKDEKKRAENALMELQLTQTQLIQSEKMASLGELTAGIAHEIQNPLNFVNNFSEVNKELLIDVREEIQKGNYDNAKEIIKDVIGNSEKINHHGKRADSIVKGMLQHSRISTGQKEPADINALADEYLRLSYHGMRAKDKGFNATIKTDFDRATGLVHIIPQDIGRVLLNLYNNAFFALAEKKKQQNEDGYEPTISINTNRINDKVEITVKDNGNGVPQNIVDKIFQPFFTTKPTGQGTGLGLSLSYDIIKAHGGEIKVETKEGEGSEFIVWLPSKEHLDIVV